MDPRPSARLSDAWWVRLLGVTAVGLFSLGLLERLRCGSSRCAGSVLRLLDLDGVGGLPRLFTTGLFVAVAVLAWRAARRTAAPQPWWWTALAALGAGLAVAKLLGLHAMAKAASFGGTLAGGSVLAMAVLWGGWRLARRWKVSAGPPVVLALGLYLTAALGLDLVTSLAEVLPEHAGALTDAAATFVEELGEALTALVVLVAVRRHLPPRPPC